MLTAVESIRLFWGLSCVANVFFQFCREASNGARLTAYSYWVYDSDP